MNLNLRNKTLVAFMLLMALSVTPSFAKVSDGSVDYSLSMQALSRMTTEVVIAMGYVVGILYAIASLLAIYNAMVIYIKLNTGEQGFTKAVLTLFGAILFLIGATVVLPAFFGYNAATSSFSFRFW